MRYPSLLVSAALVLAPGAALAKHGKVGLWNVSTTTDLAMAMPPEAMGQMKGMKMPATTHTSQMCMSAEEVNSDAPPHIDANATGCDTRILSHTGSSMTAEMTCNGSMKGKGHMQISYSGEEHYSGSYNFQGTVEGNAANMTSSFRGDWVKADCGGVRPYKLRTQ